MTDGKVDCHISNALIECARRWGTESLQQIYEIYYYGAGCLPSKKQVVKKAILKAIGKNTHIEVADDLMGAARALCRQDEGIVCILGTGSNSCFYNGHEIILHTPALGYILGDEGSGAALGKLFLNAVLKGGIPEYVREAFFKESQLDMLQVIDNVYHRPMPNRFLASMSSYVAHYIGCPEVERLVTRNFEDFIERNINPYGHRTNIVNAVGSIAYHYRQQLEVAAGRHGYTLGRVIKKPMDSLVKYHMY